MSSSAEPDLAGLDLDQVAAVLAGLRPVWAGQGLAAGSVTWRDARASWPKPIVTDRGQIGEPESVGVWLTAGSGYKGRLVIWRAGWADIDLLTGGTVTSRNPASRDLAECVAAVMSLVKELPTESASKEQQSLSEITGSASLVLCSRCLNVCMST